MALIADSLRRLEAPRAGADLARGFAAEVADPAWMLGRQWQLGEHQGEDAASPVRVTHRTRLTPIDALDGQPDDDPRLTPAEAIVESEPGGFWTVGRRVAAGRQVALGAEAAGRPLPTSDATLRLDRLPGPYARLDGTGYDGRELWDRRSPSDLDLETAWFGAFAPPTAEPADLWDPAELSYSTEFTAGARPGLRLGLDRHDGGELDWWSVDGSGGLPVAGVPPAPAVSVHPGRFRYPGAPLARWWQIEDGAVDLGGYAPDRSHVATLLLLDLVVNQSDDWFTFPVDARAGHVVTLEEVVVHDSFGESWTVEPPADWSLFAIEGLDRRSLVVWATAATPLVGPVLDEVAIGIDEDANVVWAVEQRLGGAGRSPPSPTRRLPRPNAATPATGRASPTSRRVGCGGAGTPIPSSGWPAAAASCRAGWPTCRAPPPCWLRRPTPISWSTRSPGPVTPSTRSNRPPSPPTACASSAARCWPAALTARPSSGPNAAASPCSRPRRRCCASTPSPRRERARAARGLGRQRHRPRGGRALPRAVMGR